MIPDQTNTLAVAAQAEKTVQVRGHHEADYTFVVDVPTATRGTDCFVESTVA